MDEIAVKKLATLINSINEAIRDLRQKRIHPLDIIPSENPGRIAKKLEKALHEFSNG